MAGRDFPVALLEGVLKKVSLPSKSLGLVNLTPYDCHLERVAMSYLGPLNLASVSQVFNLLKKSLCLLFDLSTCWVLRENSQWSLPS